MNDGRNLILLKTWIHLANELSTHKPILYVTVIESNHFTELKHFIKLIDPDVIVGVHGFRHFLHSSSSSKMSLDNIRFCKGYSPWFRFPFLDVNLRLLKIVSNHFAYDSSVCFFGLLPFQIGKMWEHPIMPPTDTFYRNKVNRPNSKVVRTYLKRLAIYKRKEIFATLLLHPTQFSVDLMKELRKYELPLS